MIVRLILNFTLECVPKPFDLIGILADRCNCSYVLGQTLIRKIKLQDSIRMDSGRVLIGFRAVLRL
ncbi:hypothetical protein QQ983_08160 [Leptospira borgpetersenii]|nr:hypothetical protein [Leptospira borgpetersenii]MDQ7244360.1 hypothetical protein [Leptospira borgpetersenii]URD71400.1 hypothetical protein LIX26_06190 [Leptospira borgpetersenii]UVD74577.1 hypothetical protein NU962_06225 [Leptospira borgpetersenii]UVD77770.1 hypothetical protein LIX27_06250 [Leptospira borgpetersenii]UZW34340.1 hypothetical protein OR565_06250 [Leptospira borgpetersenii]